MDYLNDMALFVEVVQANGFNRAAAKLGIPRSTLSRRIAALEDALGLRLFNRSTRRLELTGAGAYYSEAVCNGFTAVFLVKIHGYCVKNARKVSNLAALFSLYPRIFSQKTASQTHCTQPQNAPCPCFAGTSAKTKKAV